MKPLRILLVDDEPLARERLRTLLAREDGVEIAGEAEDGPAAIAAIKRLQPALVFLDVQMPGADGFAVLEALEAPLPQVIFVTAFDEFAVKAFEWQALDYLLKPFKPARLKAALDRARRELAEQTPTEVTDRLLALLEQRRAPDRLARIAVRQGERLRFVRVEDLDWIEAAGNYVVLHTGGEKPMLRETLGAFEAKLDPRRFFRVSRSAIVNLERVQELLPTLGDDHEVVLKNGDRVPMTRGVRELQERLGTL